MTTRIGTAAILVLVLGACGYDATPTDQPPVGNTDRAAVATSPTSGTPGAAAQSALLDVAGTRSRYLTDASGAALYFLEDNADGRRCDAACQRIWPPVTSQAGSAVAPEGVEQPALGALQIGQGANHLTFYGHPLYRYADDRGARTTGGHDVEDQWGHWRLMGVDGSAATPPAQDAAGDAGVTAPGTSPTGG